MNKHFIKRVATNIKKYRKEKGFSQMSLALDAGISVSTIGMIETAKTDMTLSKINAIAKALGIEAYELLK